jgi:uncharacterized protein YggE
MVKKTIYILNILFFVFAFNNLSFAHTEQEQKQKLQVSGKGEVMVKPDIAFITVSVETDAATASEAAQQNANKMQKVLKEVKSTIGKEDKVTTIGYNLSPRYEYNKTTRQSELIGYRASNRLNVETKRINKLGEIIDKSINAGANKVDSLRFGTSKQDDYRREALVKAVQDAKKTAEIVANASGVKLLKILNISPSYHYPIPLRRDFAVAGKMAMESAPTPIEAGELTVTANVNMVFEIQ